MDKKNNEPINDAWLDKILNGIDTPQEIGPDETAMADAGLTHPDEEDLERAVQQTIAENWDEEPAPTDITKEVPEQTQFFTPAPESEPVTDEECDSEMTERAEKKSAPVRDKKAKKKKGYALFGIPHILATAVWLALIVVIGVSLGKTVWLCAEDLLALGKEGKVVTITVDADDDLDSVAEKLKEAEMIKYPVLFKAFANLTGKGDSLLQGTITFHDDTIYDYNALLNTMSYYSNATVTVEVMIPEGYSCAQIFALLEENGVCTVQELEEYAANGELKHYWFLDGVKRGHKYCLEGFLFPDTYEFYKNDDPGRVLDKFLSDFDYRFTDRMVDKFMALKTGTGLDLSLYEVIIMASIVEKEKSGDVEGYSIASVFYNRMMNASVYPYLNSDATILYATDYYNAGELTTDALINASPYNTYTQTGLPPTPIANPGLASLNAALDPEDTGYYYFILDPEAGVHLFSTTLEEHEQKRRELGYLS